MAKPTPRDLPTLLPRKTALKPPHSANAQDVVKKRVFKKRNRKIASCTNCRSRKIRCNKDPTCSHCKTKGLRCFYIEKLSDLDKAPTRVVKKRNRRVKVCLNCRERKVSCNQATPCCRACQDAGLNCTHNPFPQAAHVTQNAQEQASTASVDDNDDLEQGLDEKTDSAVPKPSPVLFIGRQLENVAYGRQGEQSGVNDYSAMEHYGYATSQIQPQHRHQYSHSPLDRSIEPRYHYQGHTAYGCSGGESQVRHFDCNDQGEGSVRGTAGGDAYRSQAYSPPVDPRFYLQRQAPYNYRPLLPSTGALVYLQPIYYNHPHSMYPPRQFYRGLTSQYQEPPSSAAGPSEVYEQPKPEIKVLETATIDTIPYETRPLSLDNNRAGATNGQVF